MRQVTTNSRRCTIVPGSPTWTAEPLQVPQVAALLGLYPITLWPGVLDKGVLINFLKTSINDPPPLIN